MVAKTESCQEMYTITVDHTELYGIMVCMRSAIESLNDYLKTPHHPTIGRLTRDRVNDYKKILAPIEEQLNSGIQRE